MRSAGLIAAPLRLELGQETQAGSKEPSNHMLLKSGLHVYHSFAQAPRLVPKKELSNAKPSKFLAPKALSLDLEAYEQVQTK